MKTPLDQLELLAPAGNWECARAALAHGANAIYFGLDQFNARLRADNFTLKELPKLMNYLHEHDCRGYVTMNTLIFTEELPKASEYLKALGQAKVDGVIIQDIGLASLVKQIAPDLELHASTQMTITSAEGLHFIESILPVDQAVLARELQASEIEACVRGGQTPIEVFIHGALCVAYSGQCLTSESLGQRSANRGECAQACRMPYRLEVNGKEKKMGERRYLLSPQDLMTIDYIPTLLKMGVRSYKIEGRLKSPEYVAAVTSAYRKAIDAARQNIPINKAVSQQDHYALNMVFSRGFFPGWMGGINHPGLTHGLHGKKRGVYLGRIIQSGKGWIELDSTRGIPLYPGDGFVIDAGQDRNEECGGRIWKNEGTKLFFHGKSNNIPWATLNSRMHVWKTDDPKLNQNLKKSWAHFDKSNPDTQVIPLDIVVTGCAGSPLSLTVTSPANLTLNSDDLLQEANQQGLSTETLKKQLSRLGDTTYTLSSLTNELTGSVHFPLSKLNALRRELVDALDKHPNRSTFQATVETQLPDFSLDSVLEECSTYVANKSASSLHILCRTPEQAQTLLEAKVPSLYLDFDDPRLYKNFDFQAYPDTQVILATPRIQKPGEIGFFKLLEKSAPSGYLLRNLGALDYFKDSSSLKIGDFSLNTANPLTALKLIKEARLDRLTLSYDLNAEQVLDFFNMAPNLPIEIVIHQHMPLFHTEHCVFCSFLSTGENYKNCGRPCEQNSVYLIDRVGEKHKLSADVGCRNTVFNGKAQSGASYYSSFVRSGARHFRLEFLDETAEETLRIYRLYKKLIQGEINFSELTNHIEATYQLGITKGTFD